MLLVLSVLCTESHVLSLKIAEILVSIFISVVLSF